MKKPFIELFGSFAESCGWQDHY